MRYKFFLFYYFLHWSIHGMELGKVVFDVNHEEQRRNFTTPFQRNSNNRVVHALAHETNPGSSVPNNIPSPMVQSWQVQEQLYIQQQLNSHIDVLSRANAFDSVNAVLALPELTFQPVQFNSEMVVEHQIHLQSAIQQINRVLYDATGNPRTVLTNYEHCKVAEIITNELLKSLQPDTYLNTVQNFAAEGRPGFAAVYDDLTKTGVAARLWGGLCQGVSEAFSSKGSPVKHDRLIKKSEVRQDLVQVRELYKNKQFLKANEIVEKYEHHPDASMRRYYPLVHKLYNELLENRARDFIRGFKMQSSPELIAVLKELIPYMVPYSAKTAELYYGKLVQYENNPQCYNALKQLMNEHGLPKFYRYDESLLKTIPKTITDKDHIRAQQALFNLVKYVPESQREAALLGIKYVGKACTSEHVARYADFADAIYRAVKSEKNDKTILHCSDFTQVQSNSVQDTMLRRALPALTNVSNEINRLKEQGGAEDRINQLKALLINVNERFEALDGSYSAQKLFNEAILEVFKELKVMRGGLCLSPSQEDLYQYFLKASKDIAEVERMYEEKLNSELNTTPITPLDCEKLATHEVMSTQHFDTLLTSRHEAQRIDPQVIKELIDNPATPKSVVGLLQRIEALQNMSAPKEVIDVSTTVVDLISYANLLTEKIAEKGTQEAAERLKNYEMIKEKALEIATTVGEYGVVVLEELEKKQTENFNFIFSSPTEKLHQISNAAINFAKVLSVLASLSDNNRSDQPYFRERCAELGIVTMEEQSFAKLIEFMRPFEEAPLKEKFRVAVDVGLEAMTLWVTAKGCAHLKETMSFSNLKLAELQAVAQTAEELASLKPIERLLAQEQRLVNELESVVKNHAERAAAGVVPETVGIAESANNVGRAAEVANVAEQTVKSSIAIRSELLKELHNASFAKGLLEHTDKLVELSHIFGYESVQEMINIVNQTVKITGKQLTKINIIELARDVAKLNSDSRWKFLKDEALKIDGTVKSIRQVLQQIIPEEAEIAKKVISEIGKNSSNPIWSRIEPTQGFWTHTQIPKSFTIEVEGQKLWVNGNATEHLMEYIAPPLETPSGFINRGYVDTLRPSFGLPAKELIMSQELLLEDFIGSLEHVVREGINYTELFEFGNWKMRFSEAKISGGFPQVHHIENINWKK